MKTQLGLEEMESLRHLAIEITSQLDRDVLLTTIIRCALRLLHASGGGIYEYNEQTERLTVVADYGGRRSIVGHSLGLGEGLAGRVAKERQPFNIADYRIWPHRSSELEPDLFRAVVEAPLEAPQENILGVLYVTDDTEGRTFSDREMELLRLLASHAAIAMCNSNVVSEKDQSLTQLQLINKFDESIHAALDLKDLLQITLKEALLAVEADEGSIMILDQRTKELQIKAWIVQGEYQEKEHPVFGPGVGIAGHVASIGEPYYCPNTAEDPFFVESFTKRSILSLLSVPIITRGVVLGVVSADSKSIAFFDERDLKLMTTLANHVATAIESERLRDVGKSLSSLSEKEMYSTIVENACVLTGSQVSTIFLKDPRTSTIKAGAVFSLTGITSNDEVRQDGLTREIIETGEPINIGDAQSHPKVKEAMKRRGVGSLIGVPLSVRIRESGDLTHIGALFVSAKQLNKFGKRDVEILQSLASQAATSITKARLGEEIKQERDFQNSLLVSAFDAIVATDPDGSIRLFNQSAERTLGFKRDDVIGQDVLQLFYRTEDAEFIAEKLADKQSGGQVVNFPTFAKSHENEPVSILLSVRRLDSGMVGFFRDQREIESALRHISQHTDLLETLKEITALTDRQSVLDTTVNKTMEMFKCDAVSLCAYNKDEGNTYSSRAFAGLTNTNLLISGVDSLVRRIVSHGKIHFAEHAGQDSLVSGELIEREGISSCIACPLQVRDEIVGALFCFYRKHRPFSENEKVLARLSVGQVASVIENARLYIELGERAEQLEELYKASLGLTADLSFHDILQTLVDSARTSTNAKYTALGILTPEWKLQPFVSSGVDSETAAKIGGPPEGRGVLSALLREGESINLLDMTKHPQYSGQLPQHHPPITSFLGVPIISQSRPIGNLYAANKIGSDAFSPVDEMKLKLLAAQAAIVIERATTHETASAIQTVNIAFLLLSRWARTVREKGRALDQSLKEIQKIIHSEEALRIIKEMLLMLRELDAPRQSLQLEVESNLTQSVNISSLIRRVTSKEDVKARTGHAAEFDLMPACLVTGNALLLEFAIRILIENALEAIEAKGKPGFVKLSCSSSDQLVQVQILDTGGGIPPHLQADLYRKPLKEGSGTGYGSLAAGMIIRVHKGDIRIVRSDKEGTIISFWLPAES